MNRKMRVFRAETLDKRSVIEYYDTMKIKMNKNAQSVREQIKRQIKRQIEKGEFQPGKPVPSVRDLAAFLNINRNTVASAYKELAAEGILETIVGAGTFVRAINPQGSKQVLYQVLNEAVKKSFALGYSAEEITDIFFNCLISLPDSCSDLTILVVECNQPFLEHLCQEIAHKFKVKTEGVLINELETDPNSFAALLANSELVVCGFNHVEELTRMVPDIETKLIGCMLQPDMQIINKIMQVPEGASVGYVCVNQRSADTFYNCSFFSRHKQLKRIIAGLNNAEALNELLRDCDTVFVTDFAYEQLSIQARPGQEIIKVGISLAADSMDFIKERLMHNVRKH
jgi:GntR family transcriptional regulator